MNAICVFLERIGKRPEFEERRGGELWTAENMESMRRK